MWNLRTYNRNFLEALISGKAVPIFCLFLIKTESYLFVFPLLLWFVNVNPNLCPYLGLCMTKWLRFLHSSFLVELPFSPLKFLWLISQLIFSFVFYAILNNLSLCVFWKKQGINKHGIIWLWENDAVQTKDVIIKSAFLKPWKLRSAITDFFGN